MAQTVARMPGAIKAPSKGVFIDGWSRCWAIAISAIYLLSILIAIIVGVTGPRALAISSSGDVELPGCTDPSSCKVSWTSSLSSLSPMNQFMYVSAHMRRPAVSGDPLGEQAYALMAADVSFDQVYTLDILVRDASGALSSLVNNVTHSATVVCRAHSVYCDNFMMFYNSHISYTDLKVTVTFYAPLAAFAAQRDLIVQPVMRFDMTVVNPAYSTFEVGWRAFFATVSLLMWALFSWALCYAPGAKDDVGKRLPSSVFQRWAWVLALLLVLFNDPAFVLSIRYPTFAATVFTALCTVTFLTALLLYWLVAFHLAALQGEAGLRWEVEGSVSGLGLMFWIPKVILVTVFWVVALSLYLWSRYQQLSDPAYSVFEQIPEIGTYFFGFAYVVVGVYLLYLFALLVISCRRFRHLRRGNRVLIVLTLISILIVTVGLYLDVFTAMRTTSASFLVVYASTNLYVWFLLLAFIPEKRERIEEALAEDGAPPDTQGVMGDLDVSAADVQLDVESAKPARAKFRQPTFVVDDEDDDRTATTTAVAMHATASEMAVDAAAIPVSSDASQVPVQVAARHAQDTEKVVDTDTQVAVAKIDDGGRGNPF